MSDETIRMARAEQARQALDTFLEPAFKQVRTDYLEKLAEIAAKPLTNDLRAAMEKLAVGIKVIDQVRAQITPLVMDGELARNDNTRAAELAAMSTEKRRWAQF